MTGSFQITMSSLVMMPCHHTQIAATTHKRQTRGLSKTRFTAETWSLHAHLMPSPACHPPTLALTCSSLLALTPLSLPLPSCRSLLISRAHSPVAAACYAVVQLLGCMLGSAILSWIMQPDFIMHPAPPVGAPASSCVSASLPLCRCRCQCFSSSPVCLCLSACLPLCPMPSTPGTDQQRTAADSPYPFLLPALPDPPYPCLPVPCLTLLTPPSLLPCPDSRRTTCGRWRSASPSASATSSTTPW